MPPDFDGTILREAGEAIGNVGRQVFRRRRARQAQEVVQRWLAAVPLPQLPADPGKQGTPEEDVIDVTYRLIEDQEQDDQEANDG